MSWRRDERESFSGSLPVYFAAATFFTIMLFAEIGIRSSERAAQIYNEQQKETRSVLSRNPGALANIIYSNHNDGEDKNR